MRTGGDSIHLRERGLWNDPGSGRFVRRGWSSLKWLLNLSSDEQRLWERATDLDGSGRAIEVLLKRRHRGDIGAFDPLDVLEVYGDGHRFRGKVKVRDRKSGRQFVVPWEDIKKVDPVDRDRQIDLIAMPPGEEVRGSGSKEWFEREILPHRWFHMTDRSRLQSIAEHGIDPARGETNSDPSVLPRPGVVYIAEQNAVDGGWIAEMMRLDEPVILEIDPNQLDYTRIVPDEDYFTLAEWADPVDFGLPPWNKSKREGPGEWARRVKLGEQPGIMEGTGLTSPTPSNTYGYGDVIPPEAILSVKFDSSYDTETKAWRHKSDWMPIDEALQRIDDRRAGPLPLLGVWKQDRDKRVAEGFTPAVEPISPETAAALQQEVDDSPIAVYTTLAAIDSVSATGLRSMTDPTDPSPGGDFEANRLGRTQYERSLGLFDGVVYGVSEVATEHDGKLWSPESAGDGAYGEIKITLADNVKDRAYFTPEDSNYSQSVPLPVRGDLLPEQVALSFGPLPGQPEEGDLPPYIEVQVPGRVPVREFAAVDIETELPLDRVREIARNLRDGGMDGDGRLSIGGKDFTINELADDRQIDLLVADAMPSTKQAAIATVRDRYNKFLLTPEGYAQGDQLGAKMHSELLDLFDANEPSDADIWATLTETMASRQMAVLALVSDDPDPIAVGVLQEIHRQMEAELPDGATMDVWRQSLPDRDPFDSTSGIYSAVLRDDLPATGVTSWWGTRPEDGLKPEADWRIVQNRNNDAIGPTDDFQDKFADRKAGVTRTELTVAADRIIGRIGDMRHSGELLVSRDAETVDRLMTGQLPIVQGDSDRAARIQRLVDLLTDPPERQIDLLVADTGRRVPDEQVAVYPTSDPEPTLPGEAEAATMPVLAPAEGSVLTAAAKMSRPTFREVVTGANTDPDTVVRARAVTQATQDELARVGIDNVVLYRGVPVDEASDPFRFKPSDRISSNRRSPVMRPASGVTSWTTDKRVAAKYGQRVVKAVVPRELILSWDGVGAIAAQGQVDSPDGLLPGREVLVARSSDLVDRLIGERQIDLLVLPSTGSGFRRLTDDAEVTGSRFQPSDFADADAFTAVTAGLRDTMSLSYSGGVDSIEIQPSGKRETLDADLDVQAAWLASFPVVESLLDAVQSDDDLKELLSAGSALEPLLPLDGWRRPWQEAVELVRSEYLSRRESIDDAVARQLLYEYNMDWANSSQSIKSQQLQEAVVEMLGASVTDDYPEWDEFREKRYLGSGTQRVEPSRLDRVKARLMALSIYTLTQRTLAEQGLAPNDAIVLARGSSDEEWKAAQLLPSNKNMLVRTNPLSAMSTNSRIASNFGSTRLALRVPVSHIFSTAHTGPGTYLEEEVIGIGTPEGLIGRTIEPADYTKVVRDDIVEALQQVNADTPFEVKNWVGTPRGAAGAYATLVEPPLSDRWRRPDGSVDAERVGAVRSLFEEGGFVKLVQANEQLGDPSSLFVEPRVADGSLRWPVTIEDGDMLPRQTLFDGQRVWAVNSYNGIVHSVDSQFQTTTEITVPGGVAEDRFRSTSFSTDRTLMAFDGASLWVLQDDGVRAIDPTTGNVGTHIPVDDPLHVVANDKSVFVFDSSGDVTIVDAKTQEITDRQPTGVANVIKVKFNRDYPLVMGSSENGVPVWTQVFPGTTLPPTVHEIPQLAANPELATSGVALDIAADYESGTVYVLGYRYKTGSPPSNFEHLVLAYDEADGSLKQTFDVSPPSETMMVSDGQLHLLSRSPAQVSSSYISLDGQIENKHWRTRVGSSRENAQTIIRTGNTVSAVVRDPEEETVRVVPLTETNQVNNSRTQSATELALTANNADKLFVDDFAEVLASDPMFDDIVLPLLNAYPAEERPEMLNALTDSIYTSIDRFFTDDVRNLPNFESFKSRLATKVAGDLLQRQPVGRDRLFEPGDLRARGPHTPFEEYEHRRFRPDHVNQETAIYAFSSDRGWPYERWPDSVPRSVTHHSRGTYAEVYPNNGSSDVQNDTNGQPFTIVTPAINGQVWYHRLHHSARGGTDISPADDSEFGVLPDTPATSKIVDLWNKADQRAWRSTHELARLFLDLPEEQWPWPLPTDPDWQIADDREAMRNRIGAYGLFATVTAYMSKWRNLSPKDFLDKLRALLVDEYGLPAEDFDSNLPAIKAIIGKAQDIVRTADTESQDFQEEANRLLDEILGPPV
jgi:hypothetical protein